MREEIERDGVEWKHLGEPQPPNGPAPNIYLMLINNFDGAIGRSGSPECGRSIACLGKRARGSKPLLTRFRQRLCA